MKYYNRTKPSPSGSPVANEYSRIANSSGKVVLTKTGEINLHRHMQEQNKYLNLKALVKRASLGDTTAIPDPVEYNSTDLTKRPKNLIEALQVTTNARAFFDSLPVEIKQKHDNDFTKFLAYVDKNPNGDPAVIERLKNNIAAKSAEGGNNG